MFLCVLCVNMSLAVVTTGGSWSFGYDITSLASKLMLVVDGERELKLKC